MRQADDSRHYEQCEVGEPALGHGPTPSGPHSRHDPGTHNLADCSNMRHKAPWAHL